VAGVVPPQTPHFNPQDYPYSQQSPSAPEPINFQNSSPYSTPPETAGPAWGYSTQYDRASSAGLQQGLPSIHSFERTSASAPSVTDSWQNEGTANMGSSPYRAWATDSVYSTIDSAAPAAASSPTYNTASTDPSIRSSQPSNQSNSWSQNAVPSAAESSPQNRYGQEFPASAPPPFDGSVYAPTSYAQGATQPPYYTNSNYPHNTSPPPPPPPPPQPPVPSANPPNHRQTYTRTLVGPLSANACRLNDEHRKPGIFFLFQDLSVRTEGTYS
jgi:hypothetical protein